MSAGTAACVGFVVESGVRVSAKDHATCVECDAVVRVCCAVIEQVMDVFSMYSVAFALRAAMALRAVNILLSTARE